MFRDVAVRKYFSRCGLKIISKLFEKADKVYIFKKTAFHCGNCKSSIVLVLWVCFKDPSDFERDYMALIEWVQVPDNLTLMKDELLARGVSPFCLCLVVQA